MNCSRCERLGVRVLFKCEKTRCKRLYCIKCWELMDVSMHSYKCNGKGYLMMGSCDHCVSKMMKDDGMEDEDVGEVNESKEWF